MRVLIQRVNYGRVTVAEKVVGEVGVGLLLLVGFGKDDDASRLAPMARKVSEMRIFPSVDGVKHFDRSLLEIGGAALVVSQFTLYADTSKGRRPDFFSALEPSQAKTLYLGFMDSLRAHGVAHVAGGEFGAYMKVELENDGPVTIMVEG